MCVLGGTHSGHKWGSTQNSSSCWTTLASTAVSALEPRRNGASKPAPGSSLLTNRLRDKQAPPSLGCHLLAQNSSNYSRKMSPRLSLLPRWSSRNWLLASQRGEMRPDRQSNGSTAPRKLCREPAPSTYRGPPAGAHWATRRQTERTSRGQKPSNRPQQLTGSGAASPSTCEERKHAARGTPSRPRSSFAERSASTPRIHNCDPKTSGGTSTGLFALQTSMTLTTRRLPSQFASASART